MRGSVLIVDDDQDVSQIVAEVLSEEGFQISVLRDSQPAVIHAAIERLEPDVVLLDGGDGGSYGDSWVYAAWMRERSRPIPVIMFTAHTRELAEAQLGVSDRRKRAAFLGFLPKPFDLRVLVDTVARVVEEPAAVRVLLSRSGAPMIGQSLEG
jgi:two-component system, NtrC family, nitrogen regulation response regulator NtrX